jgi:hypothetical protein
MRKARRAPIQEPEKYNWLVPERLGPDGEFIEGSLLTDTRFQDSTIIRRNGNWVDYDPVEEERIRFMLTAKQVAEKEQAHMVARIMRCISEMTVQPGVAFRVGNGSPSLVNLEVWHRYKEISGDEFEITTSVQIDTTVRAKEPFKGEGK